MEKVTENANDMLDSAWLAIKTKTPKSEPTKDAKFIEPPQKDVSNLLVTVSLSLDAETIHKICSNTDPETALT